MINWSGVVSVPLGGQKTVSLRGEKYKKSSVKPTKKGGMLPVDRGKDKITTPQKLPFTSREVDALQRPEKKR